MRLLLDTHALLWWSDGDPQLGPDERRAIADADLVMLSVVSVWEIGTKIATGRLRLDLGELIERSLRSGLVLLDVAIAHCLRYAKLPLLHRDPFDRMLVAQGLEDDLTLMTVDRRLSAYGITCIGCG